MYLLRDEGYSKNVVNSYSAITDYLPTSSWGYHKGVTNYGGLIDYIENRDYYACTGVTVQPPITWDIWAENWELLDTNWNNEII